MAEPGHGVQRRGRPHALGAGGHAARLKDMQAALQNALRHHPVVLEQQAQRARDVQLRIAAAAVLIDAFLVRSLLVPAVMTVLGDAAWWSPGPLRRLHRRLGISETPRQPHIPAPIARSHA